ncbi:MAG: hypothetical protein SF182_12990 [Deltaproteobacteria bacterium]|nr:hypothetical protein [Deltaproteobacteria bacterium]
METQHDIRRRDRAAAIALLGLVVALGVGLVLRRSLPDPSDGPEEAARLQRDAVLFDRFSARRERSAEGDRFSVSLRLRTSASVSLPCSVFVVARNDGLTPKLWAIWPPQAPGPAITASGHFHGGTPAAGYEMTLTDAWERVTAIFPNPHSGSFDVVLVYVVDPAGRILLSRPFRV